MERLLGKNHQTINNEIKRGSVIKRTYNEKYKNVYLVDFAQIIYDNGKKMWEKFKLNVEINNKVINYVKNLKQILSLKEIVNCIK